VHACSISKKIAKIKLLNLFIMATYGSVRKIVGEGATAAAASRPINALHAMVAIRITL
jgi:hypothetical protein